MPAKELITDLMSRDDVEAQVARVTAKILKDWEQRIIISDPTIPPAQMDRMEEELAAVLLLALMQVYRSAAQELADQIQFQNPNVQAEAQDWAMKTTRDVIKQFRQDTLNRIQKAKNKNLLHPVLLASVLDTGRAVTLASTYVTQAANSAEISTKRQYEIQRKQQVTINDDGTIVQKPKPDQPEFELIWKTRRDGGVCKICSPLHNQPEEVWSKEFPLGPGSPHVRCRCYLEKKIK